MFTFPILSGSKIDFIGPICMIYKLDPQIQTFPITQSHVWKDLGPLNALKFAPTLPLESTTLTQLMEICINSYQILL